MVGAPHGRYTVLWKVHRKVGAPYGRPVQHIVGSPHGTCFAW